MIFKDLITIYGTIIIEFLFELYLLYFLITSKLRRKENFRFRGQRLFAKKYAHCSWTTTF